jgi:hypothetical protein
MMFGMKGHFGPQPSLLKIETAFLGVFVRAGFGNPVRADLTNSWYYGAKPFPKTVTLHK